jgi:Mrp family chromosome partitioning ATPase
MKELLEELRTRYDYVIIDTPPVLLISDALALTPITDGTVLVCRHNVSYVSDISRALSTLEFAKANLLGVVVNDYKIPKSVKYKSYKKYSDSEYPYGYGESRDFEEATKDKANEEK